MDDMEQKYDLLDKDNNKISCILEKSKKDNTRIVIFCHGLFSSKESDSIKELKKVFLQEGIDIIRFDQYGHGESDKDREKISISTGIASLEGVYDDIKNKGYSDIAIIGSSYGGAVTIAFASAHDNLKAIALKAPAIDMASNFYNKLGQAGLKKWKEDKKYEHKGLGVLGYIFYQDALSYDLYKMAENISAPVIVVQGTHDTSVPMYQSIKLLKTLNKQSSVEIIKGAGHQFRKPENFKKMVDYITGHIIKHI